MASPLGRYFLRNLAAGFRAEQKDEQRRDYKAANPQGEHAKDAGIVDDVADHNRTNAPRNWRLADLGATHPFLREGLGWGGMPFTMVERDLAEGVLVEIKLQDADTDGFVMPMCATYRTDPPPGPAGRWLINRFKASE